MTTARAARLITLTVFCAALAACGGGEGERRSTTGTTGYNPDSRTIWDAFGRNENPNTTIGVNKYLWLASLDVLSFLPIQTVDPFTGVIQTGYGTPPGGGRSYRATINISDPALDARSLRLSLQGPGGAPVAAGTVRAVEDAILTRARQLRLADGRL